MVLKHTAEHIQSITAHAHSTYPEECCGLLIGKVERCPFSETFSETRALVEVWPARNAWDAAAAANMAELTAVNQDGMSKTGRYWINPDEILQAQRYAREQQLEIIGVYHSHPDHPAVPSESDRAVAWSSYSYIIVSVVQGNATAVRCWCLNDQSQFEAEAMVRIEPEQS